ncbi:hypothetical protein H5J22_08715 [Cetobacterium sp. 8H]|uniref:hypothetical protein n=1 Tax=Cetobacterium sp. 8H TaxID=2759681 RepID=UPI00163B7366|nr:hypothetical protein [Cetobacterium sp. 8H]MBC2851472.1 hypothetical protein [Cetobacterium sp. 8H]
MKKLLILFSLVGLMGCSEFSHRKDTSQNIVFQNTIPNGEYNLNLISINYPKSYNEKISFYKELNETLKNINDAQKNAINLLLDNDMENDFSSLFKSGWIDNEIIGMKNAEDLTKSELDFLNTFNIEIPENAGEIQKVLNKQYYLLLKLTDNIDMYNSSYLYTELDKNLLMENILMERTSLIENLKKLEKNFVYYKSSNIVTKPIFIDEYSSKITETLENPIIFQNSKDFSGFKVLKNNLLIFVGDGKDTFSTENYKLFSHFYNLKSPSEMKENLILADSTGVSQFVNWKRKEWKNTNIKTSLETKFSAWEAIN